MPKSASQSVAKWAENAGGASGRYLEGAKSTDKDQSARAIAAIPLMQAGLNEAFAKGRVAKGLQRSGKAGWLRGVEEKGASNYGTGVSSSGAAQKYATNSGRYDTARSAANALPRGPKGSAQNLSRVAAVANAQRAVKVAG